MATPMQIEPQSEQDLTELGRLSTDALKAEAGKRMREVWAAEGRYWAAECEAMVREVKVTWPSARYLGLSADEGDGVPYWSLEVVYDASGGVLASYEIDTGEFEAFQDDFMSLYSNEYGDWFTIDDRSYFDLETRRPLLEEEYAKNITEVGV